MKISVLLEALTGTFDTDLDRSTKAAEKRMKAMEKVIGDSLKKAAVGFAAFGAAAATGLAFLVKKSIDAADAALIVSQKFGISTETFSRFTFAAGLADVPVESLTISLGKLSKNMVENADEFAKVGISVKDSAGQFRNVEEVMLDLADLFANAPDGPAKTALAMKLFGKSGADLIPILNEGREGLRRMAEESDRLGNTISGKAAVAADEFNDNLFRLRTAIGGIGLRLAETLLPKLNELVERFKDPEFQRKLLDSAEGLTKLAVAALNAAAAIGHFLGGNKADEMQRLAIEARGLRAQIDHLEHGGAALEAVFGNDTNKQLEQKREALARVEAQLRSYTTAAIAAAVPKISLPANLQPHDVQIPFAAPGGPRSKTSLPDVNEEAEKRREAIEKQVRALELLATQLGKTRVEVQLLKLAEEGATGPTLERARIALEAAAAYEKQQEALAELTKIFESARTPVEAFRAQIVRLNQLRNTFVEGKPLISTEQYEAAVVVITAQFDAAEAAAKKSGDTMTEFWREAARNMQDAFATFLFDPFKDGLDGMIEGFANTLRTMASNAAAAELFKNLGQWGTDNANDAGWTGALAGWVKTAFASSGATGGDAMPNRAYWVGEEGPELIIPRTMSTIIPNARSEGWGGGVTQVFNISTPNADSFRASQRQIQRSARQRLST